MFTMTTRLATHIRLAFLLILVLVSGNAFSFCDSRWCETYRDARSYCDTQKFIRSTFDPPYNTWCDYKDGRWCNSCSILPHAAAGTPDTVEHWEWGDFSGVFILRYWVPILDKNPFGIDSIKNRGGNGGNIGGVNSISRNMCTSMNPVNIATGNKFQKQTDIVKTKYNIGFQRFYNSRSDYSPGIGQKWTHSYSRKMVKLGYYTFEMYRPNGRGVYYETYTEDREPSKSASVAATLTQLKDSGGTRIGWRYTGTDNVTEDYDLTGNLTAIHYLNGNTETISYDAGNRISQVANSFGYSLTFAYDASNRIQSMTDQAGRIWLYGYDTQGNLKSVTNPDTTVRTYYYENATLVNVLTGITDERGLRFSTYEYDSNALAKATYHRQRY